MGSPRIASAYFLRRTLGYSVGGRAEVELGGPLSSEDGAKSPGRPRKDGMPERKELLCVETGSTEQSTLEGTIPEAGE